MTATQSNDLPQLWPQWRQAVARDALRTELEAILRDADEAITRRGPVCWASGRCCNFERFSHRLYVTGLEAAYLLHHETAPQHVDLKAPCPFQKQSLCSVHAHRPIGCRVFFCQRGSEDWQHALYEELLAKVRALHEKHDVTYRYAEWRALLDAAR